MGKNLKSGVRQTKYHTKIEGNFGRGLGSSFEVYGAELPQSSFQLLWSCMELLYMSLDNLGFHLKVLVPLWALL